MCNESTRELTLIKPCPFCGSTKALRLSIMNTSGYCAVYCDANTSRGLNGCGAHGGYKPDEQKAIAYWNTRSCK
jgi:Lar family restriction alleviation protein